MKRCLLAIPFELLLPLIVFLVLIAFMMPNVTVGGCSSATSPTGVVVCKTP